MRDLSRLSFGRIGVAADVLNGDAGQLKRIGHSGGLLIPGFRVRILDIAVHLKVAHDNSMARY